MTWLGVRPAGSGVPVPGANPGSRQSMSMVKYTGGWPACAKRWRNGSSFFAPIQTGKTIS